MMLDEFKRYLIGKNRAKNTLKTVDETLGKAQLQLKKPIESLSIEELKKHFEGLKNAGNNANSVALHQQKFIQFYQWCLDETDEEKYSILTRKLKRIKVSRIKKNITPSDILLPEDIKKLINVSTLERDRCIIAVLYESGIRIGELLALTTDMVQMDEIKQEVTFHIPNEPGCKTGPRSVVCLEIYGYVQDWLKCNPSKKFIDMSLTGIRWAIETLFKRACITKPCNVHHFRHSAITHAAGLNMSETQLSYRFWGIPHSAMLSVYIHLNEQLKSSGYRDAKGMGEGNGKTIINPLASRCVECGRLIQAGSLCKQCAEIKDLKARNATIQTDMEKIQEFIKLGGLELLKKEK